MKRCNFLWFFLLVMLVCVGSLPAQGDDSALSSFVLSGRVRIVISVETAWQRDGIVPVHVMVNGLESTLFMTPDGRVSARRPNLDQKHRVAGELFQLDVAKGELTSGAWRSQGEVYEQNSSRTRIRLEVANVELLLSPDGSRAELNLAGLNIPLRAQLTQSPDGSEELILGERPALGSKRLLLERSSGTIFREYEMADPVTGQTQRALNCWATSKAKGENK